MKRLITTALALSLLSGASALAAPQDDHRDDHGDGRPPRAAPAAPAPAAPPAAGPQAAQPQAAPQRGPGWEHNGQNGRAQAQAAPQAPQRGPGQAPQQGGPGYERGGQNERNGQFRGQAVPQPGAQRGPGWERGGQNERNDQFRGQAVPQPGAQRGPGWERGGRQGPGARPPAVRPQDRANRDFNRPRYDRRNWPFENRANRHFHWRGPAYVMPYGFYRHNWIYGEILPWGWYTPNYYIDDWEYYGLEPPAAGCEWVREGNDAVMVNIYTGAVYSVVNDLFY